MTALPAPPIDPSSVAPTPVSLGDMAELRAHLVAVLHELDELAAVETSADPEDAKQERWEVLAGVRLRLQLGTTKIDAIAALLRAARDRQRQISGRPQRAALPARPPVRKASAR